MIKKILLATAALGTTLLMQPAFAENANATAKNGVTANADKTQIADADAAPAGNGKTDTDANSKTVAQASTGAGLETVIVTAERRTENLQAVPSSVTAISNAQLQSNAIVNTQDLTLAVPGLNFARSTIAAQPTIRGVGSRSASTGNEGNVAIFVDGVYQAQPFASLFDLNDIERIEVLKGPQGTLYGRNATGGAINIITREPSFDTDANISASYGSFNYRKISGYATGAISDTLAGSISIDASKDDGYIKNVFLDKTQGGAYEYDIHGKLLYRPSDSTQFQLSVLQNEFDNPDNYEGFWWQGNSILRTKPNPNSYPVDVLIPSTGDKTAHPFDARMELHSTMVNLDGRSDLGWATLSGVVSFKHSFGNSARDATSSPYDLTYVQIRPWSNTWYGNLNLTSPSGGPFEWLIGADGMIDSTKTNPQTVVTTVTSYGVDTNAAAVYAEGTYEVADNLFLTAGARYSWEYKKAFNLGISPVRVATTGHHSWTALTPHASLRYQFAPSSNVYFTYSEGFKSGSYDASGTAGPTAPVGPEKIKAYEVGLKSNLTGDLRLNLSAFHYDYNDLQVVVIHATPTSSFSSLENAASSRINGIEMEGEYVATDHLRFNANLEYLDAKFAHFPNASVLVTHYIGGLPSGNTTISQDVSGFDLIRAPHLTETIGVNFSHELMGGQFLANVSLFNSSKYYTDVNNRVYQPGYSVLNGSLTWYAPGDHLWFMLTGKNLTNEKYITQIFESGNGDYATYQRPAAVMITVGYQL